MHSLNRSHVVKTMVNVWCVRVNVRCLSSNCIIHYEVLIEILKFFLRKIKFICRKILLHWTIWVKNIFMFSLYFNDIFHFKVCDCSTFSCSLTSQFKSQWRSRKFGKIIRIKLNFSVKFIVQKWNLSPLWCM